MTFWHYTCDHGLDAIRADAFILKPNRRAIPSLLWLTDLAEPDRDGLGLTMRLLPCDRTAHRFAVVAPTDIEDWTTARRRFRPTYVESLERAPGARPEHWFVTRFPQTARLDELTMSA